MEAGFKKKMFFFLNNNKKKEFNHENKLFVVAHKQLAEF